MLPTIAAAMVAKGTAGDIGRVSSALKGDTEAAADDEELYETVVLPLVSRRTAALDALELIVPVLDVLAVADCDDVALTTDDVVSDPL
jgi:hypothetical protein